VNGTETALAMGAMPMTEHHPTTDSDQSATIWTDLKTHLTERFRQLNSEIRHYPTPIARCDDQLPKLIEQRDHARGELERMSAVDGASTDSRAPSVREIENFLGAATPADDDMELDLRARLRAAVTTRKA
jgi:hypothetical protein